MVNYRVKKALKLNFQGFFYGGNPHASFFSTALPLKNSWPGVLGVSLKSIKNCTLLHNIYVNYSYP